MLHAFFDETGTHVGAPVTAIAGFIFDDAGLESFTSSWRKDAAALPEPFHAYPCFHGERPFDAVEWPTERRYALMDRLADLTAEHMLAGFITETTEAEFSSTLENGPKFRRFVDSPYTLCLLAMLSVVDDWANENNCADQIHYKFEAGAYHEKQTRQFVRRIRENPKASKHLTVENVSWIRKDESAALGCADLLAWEWQRNMAKIRDPWSERMKILARNGRIWRHHLNVPTIGLWGIFNLFHKLHHD